MSTLRSLCTDYPCVLLGDADVSITGISYDSRTVQPGDIYACLPGSKVHGHTFIPQVLASGAAALLVEDARVVPTGIPAMVVSQSREALAHISAEFFGHPGEALTLIGVTGTNGKTTVTTLLHRILQQAGIRSGLLGTLAYYIDEETIPAPHTTPQAPELQALLAKMRDAGLTHAVMEVSSHALCLHRIDGCRFTLALLTNVTQDHLDFHQTLDAYRDAKLELFANPNYAPLHGRLRCVLNYDDDSAGYFAEHAQGEVRFFGLNGGDYQACNVHLRADGSDFLLRFPGGSRTMSLQLVGSFNVSNALAALAAALELGVDVDLAGQVLAATPPIDGRFQRVAQSGGDRPTVVVDYAHTPDGLEKVLSTAHEIAPGRVVALFGCGGDRDRSKRPRMAEVAARWARDIIITSDNPRNEDPQAIIKEILQGFDAESRARVRVEPDRAAAIRLAIGQSAPDDLIVLAGKGHEDYQLFANGRKIHFDDREEAIGALADYHRA